MEQSDKLEMEIKNLLMEVEEIREKISEVEVRERTAVVARARQRRMEAERLHKANLQLSRQIELILSKAR